MDRKCSLKLLEMPQLCQKLGFSKTFDDKITGIVDFGYNGKVLVGNWQDRRVEGQVNSEMDLKTIYMEDYIARPSFRDTQSIWDNRLQDQGSIQLKQGNHDEYQNNLATVYDLAYRCKVRDFLNGNYGNATNYGKKECKQNYWTSEKEERTNQFHTEYTDSFSFYQCPTHITI